MKYTVNISIGERYTVEFEAEDEAGAEDLARDICHLELQSVSDKANIKEKPPFLKYVGENLDAEVTECMGRGSRSWQYHPVELGMITLPSGGGRDIRVGYEIIDDEEEEECA